MVLRTARGRVAGSFETSLKLALMISSFRNRTATMMLAAVAVRDASTVEVTVISDIKSPRLIATTLDVKTRYVVSQSRQNRCHHPGRPCSSSERAFASFASVA